MLRIVLYSADAAESPRVQEALSELLRGSGLHLAFRAFTGAREPFLRYVRNNPYLVMLVLQPGPAGAELTRLAKDANPAARLIWFSDHDYALYAYGLHLTHFGMLPVSRAKLQAALEACQMARVPPGISSLAQVTPAAQ